MNIEKIRFGASREQDTFPKEQNQAVDIMKVLCVSDKNKICEMLRYFLVYKIYAKMYVKLRMNMFLCMLICSEVIKGECFGQKKIVNGFTSIRSNQNFNKKLQQS